MDSTRSFAEDNSSRVVAAPQLALEVDHARHKELVQADPAHKLVDHLDQSESSQYSSDVDMPYELEQRRAPEMIQE